jgi:hypothetical protein
MATVTDYHRTILNLEKEHGRPPTIQEVANALNITLDKNESHKIQIVKDIISNAKEEMRIAEKNLTSDRNRSMGIVEPPQAPRDPNNPFHSGGRKSRRHAKKSRRHAKKSRRHGKKSRRHGKKSCR